MLKVKVFCHLQENFIINLVKKSMDTATKTRIDAAKTAAKRLVQKTAEATGDLIGNKIADKNTSICGFNDVYIVVKGIITVVRPNNAKRKVLHLKIMPHLLNGIKLMA